MIKNLSKNTVLAVDVTIARSLVLRMKGLLGRDDFPRGQAMVFYGCQSIHMFFMKFAIDVVFIDTQGHVIGLCAEIPPFALSPFFFKSACAIELPAGTIHQTQTCVGDRIEIV